MFPPELFVHVFSYLEFGDTFSIVSVVSHKWRAAAYSMKHIRISTTILGLKTGISDVMNRFPVLESAHVDVAIGDEILIASFSGHRTIKAITSNSSQFIEKALSTCLSLEVVSVQFSVQDFDNPSRDVGVLLRNGRKLKSLQIENPDFILDDNDYLAPNQIIQIPDSLKLLKHLSIGKCDAWFYGTNVNPVDTDVPLIAGEEDEVFAIHPNSRTVSYSDVVHFVASGLPGLLSLHFNHCNFNALPEGLPERIQRKKHDLESLKVFDTSIRVSEAELIGFASHFPKLRTLRVDVDSESFYNESVFAESLADIRYLELRGAKPSDVSKLKNQPLQLPSYRSLNSLSLWSAPQQFVNGFLGNALVANNLKSLCLNYIQLDGTVRRFELKNLEKLEVRAIGSTAGIICTRLLDSLTAASPNLKLLELGSFKRDSDVFPDGSLQTLTQRCDKLKSFKLTNFKLSTNFWRMIEHTFFELECMEALGCQTVAVLDKKFEEKEFFPFLNSHKKLKTLKLSVGGIDCAGFQVGSVVPSDSLQLAIQGMGFSNRSAAIRETRCSDLETYKKYGHSVCNKFRWLKDVSILGPLGGVDFIHDD
ncbi:UNVERIFIED_CONTAM: hypothetical protein HDU68_009681 [Siphonaria sp. JEL0065]|nr:hypothetical protein HDU68_009681 [Siphonaria sp. JEL0065]